MARTHTRRLRSLVLLLVLAVVVCAIAVAVAAETLRIESVWSTEAPAVDGKLTEWAAPLVTLGSTPLALGVRNDGQFLYVALASSDQATRMMLGAAGFTVWMDPSGKNKKSFGITVPPVMTGAPGMRGRGPGGAPPEQSGQPPDWQGTPPQGRGGPPQGQPEASGQQGQPKPAEGGPGGPAGPAVGAITSIEVLGASKEDKRRLELAYARTIGIDVAARMAEGVLVYELRVPLPVSEAQPYGVKSAPGATIGLGIESSQPPEPRGGRFGGVGAKSGTSGDPTGGGGGGRGGIPPPGMGGGGPGGMGGGGGQRGGMGGGPPEGGREGMRELKPIKIWTVVQLAKPPA
jgi:hypothetical protein